MFAMSSFGEKFLHITLLDADTRVSDGETDTTLHFFERKRDVAHGSVAQRVLQKIAQHVPLDFLFVAREYARVVNCSEQYEPFALHPRTEFFRDTVRERREGERLLLKTHRAAFGA